MAKGLQKIADYKLVFVSHNNIANAKEKRKGVKQNG